jgi:hypothetical protein
MMIAFLIPQQPRKTQTFPRPAGMTSTCEEYERNLPGQEPLLVRCKAPASHRLEISNDGDCYAVKFCDRHYQRLTEDIKAGKSLVEILDDRSLEVAR